MEGKIQVIFWGTASGSRCICGKGINEAEMQTLYIDTASRVKGSSNGTVVGVHRTEMTAVCGPKEDRGAQGQKEGMIFIS